MDFLNFTSTNNFCKICSDNINNFCDSLYNDRIKNKNCLISQELRKIKSLKNKLEKHNLRNSQKTLIKIIKIYLNFTNSINVSSYFENYIDNINEKLLCDDCLLNINKCLVYTFDIIYVYVKSYIVVELFDYISNDNILPKLEKLFDNKDFEMTVKKKLFEFKGYRFGKCSPKSKKWKGSNYYFQKFYGFPIHFYQYNAITNNIDKIINVPLEIYNLRKKNYFNDMICGHPLASHGWFREGLDELLEMDVIVN